MDASLREAYVLDQCGGDYSIRCQVENLLEELSNSSGMLQSRGAAVAYLQSPELAPGTLLDRYRVEGKIGEGGMGVVYRAVDERLNRVVALKALRFRKLDPSWGETLLAEAQMASALNHPGIVTVHDVTVWEGTPILVMELVTGTRFRDWSMAGCH
jgi:serine/threonine protein kinase